MSPEPIDQLHQIRDELTTIWLALGNTTDMADDYLLSLREALNGAANRLGNICDQMTEGGAS